MNKRVSFLIETDLLDRLRSMKARTGLSESEQIRQAIRMWLESHQWPTRSGPQPPVQNDEREQLPE